MLDNIPAELRVLPQWVVAGPNKYPINPRNGEMASVTDPSTWGTFDEARRAGYQHVGFVLSKSDPYAIIDLDNPVDAVQAERHGTIAQTIHSYSEISQSGQGVHIIVRGSIPCGVRRDKIEVYSSERYMICTGNVLNNLPIEDYNEIVNRMWSQMASTITVELEEEPQMIEDESLFQMASTAANGEKFRRLFHGQAIEYTSHSEADFALLTILAFYSKSNEQVRRIFRYSSLGSRAKAQRNDTYLNFALSKIRARHSTPKVDLTALLCSPIEEPLVSSYRYAEDQPLQVYQQPEPDLERYPHSAPGGGYSYIETPPPPPAMSALVPPGLVGEIADYVYSSAIRPVREIALAAALGLGAGILGRHFNISSTGLNQYLILIANTGTGKEGLAGGINALTSAIRAQTPIIDEFIGPGAFASGQSMTRVLDKTPSFVSILGEFGLTLQQICERNAGSHLIQVRKVLLDVYAKSGWNQWLRPSVYSDSEKNTGLVRAPNITILGESTPEKFYGALDGSHIVEGLVPRFFVIEYTGHRVPENPNAFHHPSAGLIQRLLEAVQCVLTMRANESCCPVQIDRSSAAFLGTFNVHADDKINGKDADEIIKQLWNRAHLKALKLAGLIAVGCSIHQPIVTREIAEWAVTMVNQDIENMTSKFATGKIGQGDHAQEQDIRAAIDKYGVLSYEQRQQYRVPKGLLDKPQLIPYVFLKRYCGMRAPFKNDRRGAVAAVTASLADMIKAGILGIVAPDQAKKELGVDSPVYFRGDAF